MDKAHGPKFLALVEESRKRVGELSIEDVKKKLDADEKLRLIDVREGEENAGGKLRLSSFQSLLRRMNLPE